MSDSTNEPDLLLDNHLLHKDAQLMESMKEDNTIRILNPPHHTPVLQPYDIMWLSILRRGIVRNRDLI